MSFERSRELSRTTPKSAQDLDQWSKKWSKRGSNGQSKPMGRRRGLVQTKIVLTPPYGFSIFEDLFVGP